MFSWLLCSEPLPSPYLTHGDYSKQREWKLNMKYIIMLI